MEIDNILGTVLLRFVYDFQAPEIDGTLAVKDLDIPIMQFGAVRVVGTN
jgi:hypothetical protein